MKAKERRLIDKQVTKKIQNTVKEKYLTTIKRDKYRTKNMSKKNL